MRVSGEARLAALLLLAALPGCTDAAGASLERGDRLVAEGELEAAVAEYRLARRQRGDDPEILSRLAHVYVLQGDLGAGIRLYDELVARDSAWRYQAAADLVAAGREALRSTGRERMARALEPVVPMGMELIPPELRAELAAFEFDRQRFEAALPLLLSVLREGEDPSPELRYRLARTYQELGGCREALEHFEAYLEAKGPGGGEAGSARWHYGTCLYEIAREERQTGSSGEALEHLDRFVEVGTPRTLMDRAQYLRGEILAERGRDEEALEAFRQVLRLNPARTGPLVRSAEEWIREIRYGRP